MHRSSFSREERGGAHHCPGGFFESGYIGTGYLASKGCRKIAFIGYPETVYTVRQRALGYRDFLLQRFPECPPRILTVNYRQEDSNALIRELVETYRPDGVLCATSDVCYQLVGSLGELAINIPDQIKIVTYDDNKWLDYLKFPISVITQPTSEIGLTAIEVLVRMILHPAQQRKTATEVFLQTGFIDRLYCGGRTRAPVDLTALRGVDSRLNRREEHRGMRSRTYRYLVDGVTAANVAGLKRAVAQVPQITSLHFALSAGELTVEATSDPQESIEIACRIVGAELRTAF